MKKLAGKIIFITGASRGISCEKALLFAGTVRGLQLRRRPRRLTRACLARFIRSLRRSSPSAARRFPLVVDVNDGESIEAGHDGHR